MTKGLGAALLTVCALALTGGLAASGDGATASTPAELVVRFERGADRKAALAAAGAKAVEHAPGGLVRARIEPGSSLAAAGAALERRADVVFAEPNRTYELYATPNDTHWSSLWGLPKIGAPAAWNLTQGSNSVAVAVVDSGTDYTHQDLAANIWANPGETVNGADDDGNGLVDDVRGWDFFSGDANPLDGHGHGTHVAGTIGAEGNNGAGVTGVNWRVKLIPLRVGDEQLSGFAIYQSFLYACAKGAKVVNGSFGGASYDSLIHEAIAACPSTLFVFAAGNSGTNNDLSPRYPCNDPSPNVICVAASEPADGLAWFSNFGRSTVHLAAPGASILSTVPGDDYESWDGTSMAAPHVAGAAALVLAHRPALTTEELKRTLLLAVDPKPGLAALVASGGRLNVAQALDQEIAVPTGLTASSPSHTAAWSGNSTVQVVWGGATDASGIGGFSHAFSPAADVTPDEVKDADAGTSTLTMPLPDGEHWFHVRAVDGEGNWGAAVHVGPLRIDTFRPVRPVASSPSHRVGGASNDRTIEA
ncbi:MAG TPA: S8 family peptidase, partial [Gaiellaceae bacterium]|nr:S8 family peptidase [Gaiellaceae bacterium]